MKVKECMKCQRLYPYKEKAWPECGYNVYIVVELDTKEEGNEFS